MILEYGIINLEIKKDVVMPSFDIVSEVNHHELKNAVDQTAREIDNRFDFKGSSSKIEQTENEVMLYGDNDFQLEQIKVILLTKAAKRLVLLEV